MFCLKFARSQRQVSVKLQFPASYAHVGGEKYEHTHSRSTWAKLLYTSVSLIFSYKCKQVHWRRQDQILGPTTSALTMAKYHVSMFKNIEISPPPLGLLALPFPKAMLGLYIDPGFGQGSRLQAGISSLPKFLLTMQQALYVLCTQDNPLTSDLYLLLCNIPIALWEGISVQIDFRYTN